MITFNKVYQSIVLLIAIALCTGCAHNIPLEESATYQTFIDTEQHWFELLYADDMDVALALVSEDFTSEAYVNKASLAQYMSFMQGKNILSEEKPDKSKTTMTFSV